MPNNDIQSIRAALDEELRHISHEAASIESIERRAQTRRHRSRWLIAGASTLVGFFGLLVVFSVATAPSAVADWTPLPSEAEVTALDAADASCKVDADAVDGVGSESDPDSHVADQRGNGIVVLYTNESTLTVCLAILDSTHSVVDTMGSITTNLRPRTEPLVIDSLDTIDVPRRVLGFELGTQAGLTSVVGRVDSNVVRVVASAGDSEVEATLADGFYVAWWPEDLASEDISVVAFAADGTRIGSVQP